MLLSFETSCFLSFLKITPNYDQHQAVRSPICKEKTVKAGNKKWVPFNDSVHLQFLTNTLSRAHCKTPAVLFAPRLRYIWSRTLRSGPFPNPLISVKRGQTLSNLATAKTFNSFQAKRIVQNWHEKHKHMSQLLFSSPCWVAGPPCRTTIYCWRTLSMASLHNHTHHPPLLRLTPQAPSETASDPSTEHQSLSL